MANGANNWTVKVMYNGETYYDVWPGASKEEVLDEVQKIIETEEWWHWRTDAGTVRMRTAFIGGVEVHK